MEPLRKQKNFGFFSMVFLQDFPVIKMIGEVMYVT